MLIYGPISRARRHNMSRCLADAFTARDSPPIHEWETGRLCDTRMSLGPCHWFGSRMLNVNAEDAPSLREIRAPSWFLHPSRRTVWALRGRPRPIAGRHEWPKWLGFRLGRRPTDFAADDIETRERTYLISARCSLRASLIPWKLQCYVKANLEIALDDSHRLISISSGICPRGRTEKRLSLGKRETLRILHYRFIRCSLHCKARCCVTFSSFFWEILRRFLWRWMIIDQHDNVSRAGDIRCRETAGGIHGRLIPMIITCERAGRMPIV